MLYFSKRVTNLLSLKVSMTVASYYFHCTTRPSVLVIHAQQQFCFTGALYLPKSYERDGWSPQWLLLPGTLSGEPPLTSSATTAGTRSSVHPAGHASVAKMSCLGCRGIFLPDRIFLKSHYYFLVIKKNFWKPCSKQASSLQVLLFLSCLKSFTVQKQVCKFIEGLRKSLNCFF